MIWVTVNRVLSSREETTTFSLNVLTTVGKLVTPFMPFTSFKELCSLTVASLKSLWTTLRTHSYRRNTYSYIAKTIFHATYDLYKQAIPKTSKPLEKIVVPRGLLEDTYKAMNKYRNSEFKATEVETSILNTAASKRYYGLDRDELKAEAIPLCVALGEFKATRTKNRLTLHREQMGMTTDVISLVKSYLLTHQSLLDKIPIPTPVLIYLMKQNFHPLVAAPTISVLVVHKFLTCIIEIGYYYELEFINEFCNYDEKYALEVFGLTVLEKNQQPEEEEEPEKVVVYERQNSSIENCFAEILSSNEEKPNLIKETAMNIVNTFKHDKTEKEFEETKIDLDSIIPSFGDYRKALDVGDKILLVDKYEIPKIQTNYVIKTQFTDTPKDFRSVQEIENFKPEKEGEFYHYGLACLGMLPTVFSTNNKYNEKVALYERHMNKLHLYEDPATRRWMNLSCVMVDWLSEKKFLDAPVSLESWIENQRTERKEEYSKELLEGRLVERIMGGCLYEERQISGLSNLHKRKSFLKDELRAQTPDKPMTGGKPRLIQGLINPYVQCYMGWFYTSVAKSMQSHFLYESGTEKLSRFSFSSGISNLRIGEWYDVHKKNGATFYENDFSSFDSTQGFGCHHFEQMIYSFFIQYWFDISLGDLETLGDKKGKDAPKELMLTKCWLDAFKSQKFTNGITKYYKYSVSATRKSGDGNTSVGNSFLNCAANFCAIVAFLKTKGVHDPFSKVYIMANGDDCLIAVYSEELDGMEGFAESYIEGLGLEAKFKKSGKRPTYCSSIFVPVQTSSGEDTHVLVPEMTKFLSKCGFSINPLLRKENAADRMKATFTSLEGGDYMPVYSDLKAAYSNISQREHLFKDKTMEIKTALCSKAGLKIVEEDWVFDYYGISMVDLNTLGCRLASMVYQTKGRPFYFRDPVLEEMWHNINRAEEEAYSKPVIQDKWYTFHSCIKWMPKKMNMKDSLALIKRELDSRKPPLLPRTNGGGLDWSRIRINGAPFEELSSSVPSLYESDEE